MPRARPTSVPSPSARRPRPRLLLALAAAAVSAPDAAGALQITELSALADGTALDERGEASDWIEIHNPGEAAVDLAGWTLSDDPEDPARWAFPPLVMLDPGGYLLVFASGEDRFSPLTGTLHTNFQLGRGGEYLALTPPGGAGPASVYDPYPEQVAGYTFGLLESGGGGPEEAGFFAEATPGAPNAGGLLGFVDKVVPGVPHGVFDEPFDLELTCATEGATIRYTTDGSEPGVLSAATLTYTTPLRIERTTVVRARASKAGHVDSAIKTRTYLFPADVVHQAADGDPPEGWPAGPVNGQQLYYQMHPEMVDRLGENALADALRALPSLSLVTARENLVDRGSGIYVNAEERGREWERPAHLELLGDPGDGGGFNVRCGVRIRGGISREDAWPKHSFRLFFRDEYGDAQLRHRLFGDEGTDAFDHIDLRSSTNWDWASIGYFPAGARQNTLLREVSARDAQGATGQAYTRSRYYHLFLNGLYWGIYMTQERAEESFARTTFGRPEEDYDVVKINRGAGAHTEATDGTMEAWNALRTAARAHRNDPTLERYLALQGRGADGQRDPALPALLDPDHLVDYLLVIYWTAHNDAPISQWGGNDWANNWVGIRGRSATAGGFRYFVHDAENSFGIRGYDFSFLRVITSEDRTGPYTGSNYNSGSAEHYNPQFLHQDLHPNAEYRLRFADRAEKHLGPGGALNDADALERFRVRRAQVAPAIPAHAARWGYRFAGLGNRYDERDWAAEADRIEQDFIAGRTAVVWEQLRADDLLAPVETPRFEPAGGTLAPGGSFSLTAPVGASIYLTTDGTDPRLPGGGVAPGAVLYPAGEPFAVTENITVRARAQSLFGLWSALAEATFLSGGAVPVSPGAVYISEIHYHPAAPTAGEIAAGFDRGSDFEFIEFFNPGDEPVSLDGARLVDGVRLTFGPGHVVPARGYLLLAGDAAALAARYGAGVAVSVAGEFEGNLSNGGERIALVDAAAQVLAEVDYDDDPPWPAGADGAGFSLVRTDGGEGEPGAGAWAAGTAAGGSPGTAAPPPGATALFGRPGIVRGGGGNDAGFSIRWTARPGTTYRLEYRPNLGPGPGAWVTIGELTPATPEATLEDDDPGRTGPAAPAGFYRLSAEVPAGGGH